MKTIAIIIIVVAALAAPLLVCRPRDPRHVVDRIFKDISNKLDLTEAQTSQLNGIRDEIHQKAREMRQDREKMHREFSRLILSDSIDSAALKADAKEKHARIGESIDSGIERLAEFHATLTPEQKNNLAALLEVHGRRIKRWHR